MYLLEWINYHRLFAIAAQLFYIIIIQQAAPVVAFD